MEYGRRDGGPSECVSFFSVHVYCYNVFEYWQLPIYIYQQSWICLKHIYKIMLQRCLAFSAKMRIKIFCVILSLIFLSDYFMSERLVN